MAIAAGIEIATGANPGTPGLSTTALAGVASASAADGAESFQSRWQSLLESLGKTSSSSGAGGTDGSGGALDKEVQAGGVPVASCPSPVADVSSGQRKALAVSGNLSVSRSAPAGPRTGNPAGQPTKSAPSQPPSGSSSRTLPVRPAPASPEDGRKASAVARDKADSAPFQGQARVLLPIQAATVPMGANQPPHLLDSLGASQLAAADVQLDATPGSEESQLEIPGLQLGEALPIPSAGHPAELQATSVGSHREAATGVSWKTDSGPLEPAMRAEETAADKTQPAPTGLESKISSLVQIPAESTAHQVPGIEVARSETGAASLASGAGDGLERLSLQAESALSPPHPSRAAAAMRGNAGASAAVHPSAEAAFRVAHAANPSETPQHPGQGMDSQSAEAGQDASSMALVHDPSGLRGAVTTAARSDGQASSSTFDSTGQGTIAALDADAGTGRAIWTHAGSQHAEAGFQDPALGWVSVRADLGGAGIHAALVPGSADAAQALGGHIAGLNAYLAERHSGVETLTLAAPDSSGPDTGMNQGAHQSMHQGTGQSFEQGGEPGPHSRAELDAAPRGADNQFERNMQPAASAGVVSAAWQGAGHISVIA